MKYVFLFCGSTDDQAAFDSLSPEVLRETYAAVGKWFADNRSRLGPGNQLQGPQTATTVHVRPGTPPVVKDGPFMEGKEIVGGYTEVDVADLDEALALAKSWPGLSSSIEIRPVMEPQMRP